MASRVIAIEKVTSRWLPRLAASMNISGNAKVRTISTLKDVPRYAAAIMPATAR
jgi:hypothetical protein